MSGAYDDSVLDARWKAQWEAQWEARQTALRERLLAAGRAAVGGRLVPDGDGYRRESVDRFIDGILTEVVGGFGLHAVHYDTGETALYQDGTLLKWKSSDDDLFAHLGIDLAASHVPPIESGHHPPDRLDDMLAFIGTQEYEAETHAVLRIAHDVPSLMSGGVMRIARDGKQWDVRVEEVAEETEEETS